MINVRRRSALRVLEIGRERCRIGPWRGDPSIGYLSPLTHLSPRSVDHATEELRHEGYRGIITGAVGAGERGVFADAGYDVRERLHLLRHPLREIPPGSTTRTRRATRRQRAEVLELDRRAFQPFWHLDEAGLDEARQATPISRFRTLVDGSTTLGYTISGRAGSLSYLQRLAVHPDAQGRGLGRDLTIDALTWARRRRCLSMMVNTQESNTAALALYESLGFARQAHGLFVLERSLER
ncbi:MAG: GNAT family N-acetyltransferase [Acidimicrobiales bacterium]